MVEIILRDCERTGEQRERERESIALLPLLLIQAVYSFVVSADLSLSLFASCGVQEKLKTGRRKGGKNKLSFKILSWCHQ